MAQPEIEKSVMQQIMAKDAATIIDLRNQIAEKQKELEEWKELCLTHSDENRSLKSQLQAAGR